MTQATPRSKRLKVGLALLFLALAGGGGKLGRDYVRDRNRELEELAELDSTFDKTITTCAWDWPGHLAEAPDECRKRFGADLDRMLARGFDAQRVKAHRDALEIEMLNRAPRYSVLREVSGKARDALLLRLYEANRNQGLDAMETLGASALAAKSVRPTEDHEIYRSDAMLAARDVADLAAWKAIALPSQHGTSGPEDEWHLFRGASLCVLGERAEGRAALGEGASQTKGDGKHFSVARAACADPPDLKGAPKEAGDPKGPGTANVVTLTELARALTRAPLSSTLDGFEVSRRSFHCAGDAPVDPSSKVGSLTKIDGPIEPWAPEDWLYETSFSGSQVPPVEIGPEALEAAAALSFGFAEAAPRCHDPKEARCAVDRFRELALDWTTLAARARVLRGELDAAKALLARLLEGRPRVAAQGYILVGEPTNVEELAAKHPGSDRLERARTHYVLARARVERGEWEIALAEAQAADAELVHCFPKEAPRAPGPRMRTLALVAAISIRLGISPPPELFRYEADAEPHLHFEPEIRPDSEIALLMTWRAAIQPRDEALLDERVRILSGPVYEEGDCAHLYAISRLAGAGDAEAWLDAVEGKSRAHNVMSLRGRARLRAFCRATVGYWRKDREAGLLWTNRLGSLSSLARAPGASTLAFYVGL